MEAELRHFVAQQVSQVVVLDLTFNQDVTRAKAILRLIARIAPQIHFHFEVRAEFIDAEMARLFAGIIRSLQIGLQSAESRRAAGSTGSSTPRCSAPASTCSTRAARCSAST